MPQRPHVPGVPRVRDERARKIERAPAFVHHDVSVVEVDAANFVVARTLSRVATKTAGRVARVNVVEGQEVHEGDVLRIRLNV